MATSKTMGRGRVAELPTPASPPRTTEPVRWWAAAGAVVTAAQLWAFVTWFTRGDAKPVHPTVEVPGATRAWAVTLQAVMVVAFVAMVAWVVRGCLRERRLTLDAVLVLGWASVFWLDPAANYVRPIFLYNSELVNLGSWVNGIPGWTSPNMERLPEPLLMIGLSYVAFGMGMTLILSAVMRAVRRRHPGATVGRLLVTAFVVMVVLELAAELVFVRTGLYAYSGVIRDLSMWGGKTYQYPVYSAIFAAPVFVGAAAFRELRDDRGRCHIERGVDRVSASPTVRGILRSLAAAGFINVALIVGYFVPMVAISLHVDQTPTDYPAYFLNGICGNGSTVACPGPGQPIPTRSSVGH